MKKLVLFSILFLSCSFASFACSCQGPQYFCGAINSSYFPKQTSIIIKGLKIDHDTLWNKRLPLPFMRIKVLSTIQGEIKEDTVVVLGQDGLNCNQHLSVFSDNDTLILAFWGASDTMDLTVCARSYLHIKNGNVEGDITSKTKTSMPYDSFLTFMQSAPCQTADIIEKQQLKNSITVSPNPGNGTFYIYTSQSIVNATINIYNSEGRLVYSDCNISAEANIPYPVKLEQHPSGIYFIKLTDGLHEMNTKLIKSLF